jgi:transposase-like protein
MNDTIVKSDRRGRLRYTPEQKAALVEAYQSSGLSGPRFAAIHGVNYQTLASWLQKLKQTSPASPSAGSSPRLLSLIPAEIEGLGNFGAGQALEIMLPGGVSLSISTSNQAQLAAILIRELQQTQPC